MSPLTYTSPISSLKTGQGRIYRLYVLWAFMLLTAAFWLALISPASAGSPTGGQPTKGAPPQAPNCDPNWQLITSPNATSYVGSHLTAVDGIAANDVWAVGHYDFDGSNAKYRSLIQHWDGAAWTIVPSPNPGEYNNYLFAVDAVSTNDVWAVGRYSIAYPADLRVFILHWNGISWKHMPSSIIGELDGIAAISSNDVWAVGIVYGTGALIMHWDGSLWSVVSGPITNSNSKLVGISAVSSSDVWAVGYMNSQSDTLIEHWNGTSWSIVTSPNGGNSLNMLNSVTAVSSNYVWAVGYYYDSGVSNYRTLIMRWNGTSWSKVSSPNMGADDNELFDVAHSGAGDIWAVGIYVDTTGHHRTLTLHWNGVSWSIISSPSPTTIDWLSGVTAVSGNSVWAVGRDYNNNNNQSQYSTLTEFYNGTSWSVVASPDTDLASNTLNAVDANSGGNVWAVGSYAKHDHHYGQVTNQTLIEHWNGSHWSVITSPNVGTGDNRLTGVSIVSASDIWAVGYFNNGTLDRPMAFHWNGVTWSVATLPNIGVSNTYLSAVSARATNDVWAVGSFFVNGKSRTLVLRYNGTSWSTITSPNTGLGSNALSSVFARASNDAWAVGYYNGDTTARTLVLRYNGTSWSTVASPNIGAGLNILSGVTAPSSTSAWAIGSYLSGGIYHTLIMQWNGTSWSTVTSPDQGSGNNFLYSIDKATSTDIWAVGKYYSGTKYRALIEHWDGTSWNVVTGAVTGTNADSLNGVAAVSGTDIWATGSYAPNATSNAKTLTERYNPCN